MQGTSDSLSGSHRMLRDRTRIRERIESLSRLFTVSEHELAATLLSDYPFAGLDTIQALASKTPVSAPTISRFVHKIGCKGYQDVQRQLIGELQEAQRSPVILHRTQEPLRRDFLEQFLARSGRLAARAADSVTHAQFERVCGMLAEKKRSVDLLGGRTSDPMAQILSRHLRLIRPSVYHLPSDPEMWHEYVLRMKARDVFVAIDFRRYQSRLEGLAELAVRTRGVGIVLFTHPWLSPVSRHATDVVVVPTEIGTAWDSYVATVAIIEALIVNIAERDWSTTRKRINAWDALRPDHGSGD